MESRPIKKRRSRACQRCNRSKIRCTFEKPCASCKKAGLKCDYGPRKDWNEQVSGLYLERLEERVQQLESHTPISPDGTENDEESNFDSSAQDTRGAHNQEAANPLLQIDQNCFSAQASSAPVYIGQASCTFFLDCLLQSVNPHYRSLSCNTFRDQITHPVFQRLKSVDFQLPRRSEADLLVRRAISFIGTDYQLCLRRSVFDELDRAYKPETPQDLISACHLLALLAIGELYSPIKTAFREDKVPGTTYFVQATGLLQDLYETASVEQVQVYILLSFYCNVLGRVKHAHIYCGIAMRLGIHLGLHRSTAGTVLMNPIERENRRRVWWTCYLFDRLISSKLGYPLAIRDDDIDVEYPSMDDLTPDQREEFFNPANLKANVKLASITGDILTDLHCLARLNRGSFPERVQRILSRLRSWEQNLPEELRIQTEGSPRNLYSLHLHKNLCIIQTTRSILLHVFKSKFVGDGSKNRAPSAEIPEDMHNLVGACIQAARTTNQYLSALFENGMLACFGYFDAHYSFTSTTVLMIAAMMEPSSILATTIQHGFSLLGMMADHGNISARDYSCRLEQIRASLDMNSKALVMADNPCSEGMSTIDVQLPSGADETLAPSFSAQEIALSERHNDPFVTLGPFLASTPDQIVWNSFMEHAFPGFDDVFLPAYGAP